MSAQGRKWLWMFTEGITEQIIIEESRRLRVSATGDDAEALDKRGHLKLGDVSAEDSLSLRAACYARIGISDPDEFERQRLINSPFYKQWEEFHRTHPPLFMTRDDRDARSRARKQARQEAKAGR